MPYQATLLSSNSGVSEAPAQFDFFDCACYLTAGFNVKCYVFISVRSSVNCIISIVCYIDKC